MQDSSVVKRNVVVNCQLRAARKRQVATNGSLKPSPLSKALVPEKLMRRHFALDASIVQTLSVLGACNNRGASYWTHEAFRSC